MTKHIPVWYTLSMETKNFTICYKDNDTSKMIVTLWDSSMRAVINYEEVKSTEIEDLKFLEKLQQSMIERGDK